jgi:hypothetical protein
LAVATDSTRSDETPESGHGEVDDACSPRENDRVVQVVNNQVVNQFLAETTTSGSNFGIASEFRESRGSTAPRETGPMQEADIARSVERFVEPSCFSAALVVLQNRSVLVLRGPAGTGKRTGALALLRYGTQRRSVTVLSPGLSVEELRRYEYKEGRDYLILDRPGGKDDPATFTYHWEELAKDITLAAARLVLTTTVSSREFPDEFAVNWEAPGSAELIDRYISDPETAVLVRQAAGDAGPRDIARLAEELERSDDVAIDTVLERAGLEAITRWLDGDPAESDVLLAVSVSFGDGLTETECEEMLAQLEEAVSSGRPSTDHEQSERLPEPVLRQRRRDRLVAVPMLMREPSAASVSAAIEEPSLTFTSSAARRRTLEQLWDRYDVGLWGAVRRWLDAAIEVADDRRTMTVTAGLALLARAAPEYVLISFLQPWASRGHNSRRAACYVTWHAAYDDAVSSWALDCALGWVRSSDVNTKRTAILCLAGPIGTRYPAEAIRRLWRLAQEPSGLGREARDAVVTLTRNAALSGVADLTPLRYIAAQLTNGSRGRADRFETALQVADLLVTANDTDGRSLGAALAKTPGAAASLARIWAVVLVHRPHRRSALDGLARALVVLGPAEGGLDAIKALGSPLLTHLPAAEQQLLRHELPSRLAGTRAETGSSKAIVSALLEAGARFNSDAQTEEGP